MRRPRNTAQMKEEIKILEKELNKMEITNLSDSEFKALMIRMFKELTEDGNNIREDMKVKLNEILKKQREPAVERMKPGIKSTIWNTREEKTFNQNSRKKKEFKKMRRGLGTNGTTLNVPTSKS